MQVKTIRLKVKPNSARRLNEAAIEVNQVWNWINERQLSVRRNTGQRLGAFDLVNLTSGSTNFFEHIGAGTINAICLELARKLRSSGKDRLSWRVSFGARRSLGWVPVKGAGLRHSNTGVRMLGKNFRVFNREYLADHKFRDGCFAQDACGDWWLCLPVSVEITAPVAPCAAVGVDLGLKTAAVTSDGERLESGTYRHFEPRIAQAQRRGHKRQAKRLHRKAARVRLDAMHKFSTNLVRKYQRIYVGDVSSAKLIKTRMAKSVHDAGWYALKTQLEYKCQQAAREFQVVDERYTTRACSGCGALTGPTGLAMLSVRQFSCDACGEAHDRDVNAARNIRTVGLRYRASVSGNERLRMNIEAVERKDPPDMRITD